MRASGFEVVHSEVVGIVASIELGRVGPEVAYEFARRTDRPEAEAIVMPGGNWNSMPVVERLESELGKPILVNNAVSLWAGLAVAQANRQHQGLRPPPARPSRCVNWRKPNACKAIVGRQQRRNFRPRGVCGSLMIHRCVRTPFSHTAVSLSEALSGPLRLLK